MQDYNDIGIEDMAHVAATHDSSSTTKKKNNHTRVQSKTNTVDSTQVSTAPILDNGIEEMAYIAAQAEAPKRKPSVASKIKDYIESIVHGKDDTHTR